MKIVILTVILLNPLNGAMETQSYYSKGEDSMDKCHTIGKEFLKNAKKGFKESMFGYSCNEVKLEYPGNPI